jgi:glycosyltransferase involved in cell wall biosynthesis
VNEREFVLALLQAFGDRARIVVPASGETTPELGGDRFVFCRGFASVRSPTYLAHQFSQARVVQRLLGESKFDLLIFRLNVLPLAQWWITRRNPQVPYVIKTLGGGVLEALDDRGGELGRAVQPLNTLTVRDLVTNALAVDACTPELVTLIGQALGMPTGALRVIENATNTTRFRPADPRAARRACSLEGFDPIVGLVGGEPWNFGGRQLVELAPELLRIFPNLGLVIVGGGSNLDVLRKRAGELGVATNCVIPGLVPYEQVPDYVNSFDIGISLDHASRSARIGTSFQKVRQYVACGKPVISQPGGNAFLEENDLGSIVPAEDLRRLRDQITRWISLTPEERTAHSRRAAAFAQEHLSVERALQERLEFWEERMVRPQE